MFNNCLTAPNGLGCIMRIPFTRAEDDSLAN
uniref:Uncharacterized protein n=1 Tax=Rhizophora mucronata TaxID=61149 RepID=A0A2P2QQD7_RHIMU